MTVQGILDTLRRSPDEIRTWDEVSAAIGAALLRGLTQAEVSQLADGVSRIAGEGQRRVLVDLHSSSRMVLAVLRGASHALAEEVSQELEHPQRPSPKLASGKTWVCASCGERYDTPDPNSDLICCKVIQDRIRGERVCDGDIFFMNEPSWPCTSCSEPLVTYLDLKEGVACQECWDRCPDMYDRT